MGEIINFANAILILGVLYMYINYSSLIILNMWVRLAMAASLVLALLTWSYHGMSNKRKEYLVAKIDCCNARKHYYESKASWYDRRKK